MQFYSNEKLKVTIYTGDMDTTAKKILEKAQNTFNITVNEDNLSFVFLEKRRYIEADRYPRFTLLFQSLGSIWLGLVALMKHQPGRII